MTDLGLHISAVDTLMFRDGRPFNQNDAGASVAASVFPPYPPTLVGAIRAALWQGPLKGKWDGKKLGTGTNWQLKSNKNYLNPLSFGAPLVLQNGSPVFPVPLHILEGMDETSKQVTRLHPVSDRACDLGKNVKIPTPKNANLLGVKPIEDCWVSDAGMKKILRGDVPEHCDLVAQEDLWGTEPRVGIGIDHTSRTTNDGKLYMASHVRMADNVSLYVHLKGWEGTLPTTLQPMAGEHRMAEISATVEPKEQIKLPIVILGDAKQACLIATSPIVSDGAGNISGLENLDVISACLGKSISIGGWNSQGGKPIGLRQCYPAGSVWFVENKDGQFPGAIGEAMEWGFGQVMIGKW